MLYGVEKGELGWVGSFSLMDDPPPPPFFSPWEWLEVLGGIDLKRAQELLVKGRPFYG